MPFLGASGDEAEAHIAAFRRSLALEALAYALDRTLGDFASLAVFSAGFATVDPNDTWTRLVADHPST